MISIERNRILSRMFTRPVMAAIARSGSALPALSFLATAGVADRGRGPAVLQLFESAFEDIRTHYRNEYVYKAVIANRIIFGRHSPRTAAMQVELQVGRSIVDVAVFNGTSTAYEIKTELDTGKRLNSQSADYLKGFDRVYLVTHPEFVQKFERLIEPRVGIISLTRHDSLSVVRKASSNFHNVSPMTVLRMLRRSEYIEAATKVFGSQPQVPNGLLFAHYEKLFSKMSPEQAHVALVSAMRARTTDTSFVDFISALPQSLRALGYATPMSSIQRTRLLSALASPANLRIR